MTTPSTPSAAHWRRFIVGMTIYALAIVAASLAVRLADPPTAARIALALAPAAAVLWAMSGWLAAVRAFDELARRVFAEAAAITLGVVLAVAMTSGLLQAYVGVAPLNGFVLFAIGGVSYSAATLAVWRRYR